MTATKQRDNTLDFLKGILIILVVMFHLELTVKSFPTLVRFVYTFHMPAFLMISGYLFKVQYPPKKMWKTISGIAIPYILFELIYLVALFLIGSKLQSSNTATSLSWNYLASGLFLHPKGVYWYFYTIIICMCVYYLTNHILHNWKNSIILTGVTLFIIQIIGIGIRWENIMYYMLGATIAQMNFNFVKLFKISAIIALPLFILAYNPENYNRASLAGIGITICMISLMIWLADYSTIRIKNTMSYIGRNTLSIMCYSPIFTVLSKKIAYTLQFDRHGIITIILITVSIIVCCLLCAWITDKLNIAKIIFFRKRVYSSFD